MILQNIIIIFNLFILESLLSIDNAAVLAIMVKDLSPSDRPKALKYGIIGAFVFRGISLFLAAWLIKIVWLKIVGGLYLLYLVYDQFKSKKENDSPEKPLSKPMKIFGLFWSTVILVEIMDMAFSIDNIFAAVAMTNNLALIITGVFIGILAMRYIAQWFSIIIARYPSLEVSAFMVILLLGCKLIISGTLHYFPSAKAISDTMESNRYDFFFSASMILIFLFPIIFKRK